MEPQAPPTSSKTVEVPSDAGFMTLIRVMFPLMFLSSFLFTFPRRRRAFAQPVTVVINRLATVIRLIDGKDSDLHAVVLKTGRRAFKEKCIPEFILVVKD